MKPRLLDLYCGPGGAAAGYIRAGWDVTGIDLAPQPGYPGAFIQGDALAYPLDGFDAVHASPPCEAYSHARRLHSNGPDYVDLLALTRDRLAPLRVPWVIENVPGSPIRAQLWLCGTMFGLQIHRHRYFELNWSAPLAPFTCDGTSVRHGEAFSYFGGKTHGRQRLGYISDTKFARLMGIDWCTGKRARKSIPPAYTEWIGREMIAMLGVSLLA